MSKQKAPEIHLEMRVVKPTVGNGGYAHVFLDPFRFDDDGKKKYYGSSWSHDHPSLYFPNLRIVSQIDGKGESESYAWGIEYRDIYSLNRWEANKMSATLNLIDRRLDKLNTKEGRPQSFGQYVNRAMRVLGAKSVYYTTSAAQENHPGLVQTWKPGDVAYIVDTAVREVREEAVKMVEGGLVR